MIVSPWSQLNDAEQLALASKLIGLRETNLETDQLFEAAAERFDQFVIEYDQRGALNQQATQDNLLTAQNFIPPRRPVSPARRQSSQAAGSRQVDHRQRTRRRLSLAEAGGRPGGRHPVSLRWQEPDRGRT